MMKKRKISGKKQKSDMAENNGEVDTSMGKKYMEQGRVVILENRFYKNLRPKSEV